MTKIIKLVKEQIKFYLKQNTKYENGLQSLLDELEETAPRGFNKITRRVSSITHVDPSNAEDRLELYDFYEERFPLYLEMKNIIREVLTLWDRVEEMFEGEGDNRKSTGKFQTREGEEEYIEELDNELEELKEIHNLMDDKLNYILKVPAIPFNVTTAKDSSVSENVRGMVLEKIKGILGHDASEIIQEIQDDDDEFTYGEDEMQTVGYDNPEEEGQPMAEINLEENLQKAANHAVYNLERIVTQQNTELNNLREENKKIHDYLKLWTPINNRLPPGVEEKWRIKGLGLPEYKFKEYSTVPFSEDIQCLPFLE